MNLVGSYQLQLDERDRMRIPSKLRAKFDPEDPLYIMLGTQNALFIVNEEGLEKITGPLEEMKLSDASAQVSFRNIMLNVFPFEEDGQGRFVLPEMLKRAVGIDKKLIFIGMKNRIEVVAGEYRAEGPRDVVNATDVSVQTLKANGYDI